MVIVNGRATQSCATPLWSVEDAEVITIEGLESGGSFEPLLQPFEAVQAAQCGYCIAGIVMSARALLDRDPIAVSQPR